METYLTAHSRRDCRFVTFCPRELHSVLYYCDFINSSLTVLFHNSQREEISQGIVINRSHTMPSSGTWHDGPIDFGLNKRLEVQSGNLKAAPESQEPSSGDNQIASHSR
ncbi:hypothetical protein PoB_006930900 [Plakobranchus ocellatus]|uniref:Uncharacterized protein n=1 Tax=Plakobranchus ocellatus TaxID=259542 RepID=A0AAV4DF28_9GAST|nr:hypothetical protein PoB_006930900 [Plakobranchus ocellatus]